MDIARSWLALLRSGTPANRYQQALVALLLAIPFAGYAGVVLRYTVNVPFWDDLSMILYSTNTFVEAGTLQGKLRILFASDAGHTLLMTRLVAVAQYYLGGINIRNTLLFSNLGWMLTVALLMAYAHRQQRVPLLYLLPVPYLMLALSHWEGIDFATAAIQMYWGSSLCAVACLLALTAGRGLLAGVFFTCALFWSGGSIALYPLALLYCLLLRQWRTATCFLLVGAHALVLFAAVSPAQAGLRTSMPALPDMARSILAFMGNLWASGQYQLAPLATAHRITGALLLLAGGFFIVRSKGNDLPKLVLLYVLALAVMAAYARGPLYNYVAISRYAQFALLGAACVYLLGIAWLLQGPEKRRAIAFGLVAVVSAGFWTHTMAVCQDPLAANRQQRLQLAANYLATGNSRGMISSVEYGNAVLGKAAALGVFKPESMRQHTLPAPQAESPPKPAQQAQQPGDGQAVRQPREKKRARKQRLEQEARQANPAAG